MNYNKSLATIKELKSLITQLNDCIVIVEGKRDVIALEKIGVNTHVFTYEKFIRDNIRGKNAVILTDYDREGEVKRNIISSLLIERGIIEHEECRRKFERIFGVKTIEEVPPVFDEIIKGD